MIRVLLFLNAFLFCPSRLLPQTAPSIQWQKSLGGSYDDEAYSIQQTIDHGFIVAGGSYSNDGDVTNHHGTSNYYDFWIARLDSEGTLIWQKSLGGSHDDLAEAVEQTHDGGFIVAGFSDSNGGDVTGNHGGGGDYWIVKLDSNGNLLWQKCFGGSGIEQASSIHETSDKGFILNGYTLSNDGDVSGNHGSSTHDYWVVKIDSIGNILWQKCLGGTSHDNGEDARETEDGGYIVSGSANSNDGQVTNYHGGGDCWVVKLDSAGNLLWQRALGGTYSEDGTTVRQTANGGYVVIGSSSSNDGDVTGHHGQVNYPNFDYWITRLDANGNLLWQKSLGGTYADVGSSIEEVAGGGFIVSGTSYSNDGDVTGHHGPDDFYTDYWIARLDTAGSVLWEESLGGDNYEEGAHGLQQTIDGGFIVAGWTASMDGDVTVNHGAEDFWVVELGADISTNISATDVRSSLIIYPNPFSSSARIQFNLNKASQVSIKLFSIDGKAMTTMVDENFTGGEHQINFNCESLPAGIYFLQFKTSTGTSARKIIVQ